MQCVEGSLLPNGQTFLADIQESRHGRRQTEF